MVLYTGLLFIFLVCRYFTLYKNTYYKCLTLFLLLNEVMQAYPLVCLWKKKDSSTVT